MADVISSQDDSQPHAPSFRSAVIRKLLIVFGMVWAIVVTILRAQRLPNDFSKEHWFIDYRFGFVKRGLVGTIVSLATRLVHAQPTEGLVNALSIVLFVIFCGALMVVGLRVVRRSGWSVDVALAVLVFLSSPFLVMSAHLVGYFDDIIILLTILSLAMLVGLRVWSAIAVQIIAILVHENALLVGFPAFALAWWLVGVRGRRSGEGRWPLWPILLPPVTFLLLALSQSLAPSGREEALTSYLSTYPFIAKSLPEVGVPDWIMIMFFVSFRIR